MTPSTVTKKFRITENVLKLFTTKLISFLLCATLGSECKYLSEGIKFNSTYCSFHVTHRSIYNSIESMSIQQRKSSPEKRCSIFNSFTEINHVKSIESLRHTRELSMIFFLMWEGNFYRVSDDNRKKEMKILYHEEEKAK